MTAAVEVKDGGVYYRLQLQKRRTLRRDLIAAVRANEKKDFWALRHVNLQVSRGEVLGIIGKNGAGKSTLLKLVAGILSPDEGEVTTTGRISTLLQLGAGFEPELSGRENIYLSGLVLGLRKTEIDERMEEITRFAQLGEFIDAPLKHYSSGMHARLGFSVACCVDPDILLIDEILMVGDETFRERSYERMLDFRDSDKTILLVSHSLDKVQSFCSRAIWMNSGALIDDGDTASVVAAYRAFVKK